MESAVAELRAELGAMALKATQEREENSAQIARLERELRSAEQRAEEIAATELADAAAAELASWGAALRAAREKSKAEEEAAASKRGPLATPARGPSAGPAPGGAGPLPPTTTFRERDHCAPRPAFSHDYALSLDLADPCRAGDADARVAPSFGGVDAVSRTPWPLPSPPHLLPTAWALPLSGPTPAPAAASQNSAVPSGLTAGSAPFAFVETVFESCVGNPGHGVATTQAGLDPPDPGYALRALQQIVDMPVPQMPPPARPPSRPRSPACLSPREAPARAAAMSVALEPSSVNLPIGKAAAAALAAALHPADCTMAVLSPTPTSDGGAHVAAASAVGGACGTDVEEEIAMKLYRRFGLDSCMSFERFVQLHESHLPLEARRKRPSVGGA